MKKQQATIVRVLAVILFSASVIGCQKNTDQPTAGSKSINVFVTDDPSTQFDNIFVDIQKIEVKAEDENEVEHESETEHGSETSSSSNDDHGSTSGGWMTLNSKSQVVDILKFRNGLDTLFSSGLFQSTRSLKKVRITLGNNNTAVVNGVITLLKLKKNTIDINLENEKIEQKEGGEVKIWLDIDGGRSINKTSNGFEFEPVVRAFSREKAGSVEGRITPADAAPIVMAISGTDTATAKPGHEGEFKIIGLKAGSYKLVVHPTAGTYKDAVIENVKVSIKEDTHVNTIALHK